MYMEEEQKQFLKAVKYHAIAFFAAFLGLYIIAAFVAWEWRMKEWWWSIRFFNLAFSVYLSYMYAPLFYKKEEEILNDEYYGTP